MREMKGPAPLRSQKFRKKTAVEPMHRGIELSIIHEIPIQEYKHTITTKTNIRRQNPLTKSTRSHRHLSGSDDGDGFSSVFTLISHRYKGDTLRYRYKGDTLRYQVWYTSIYLSIYYILKVH
jgi:DNA gyrase/topoisomerase IV subunit A